MLHTRKMNLHPIQHCNFIAHLNLGSSKDQFLEIYGDFSHVNKLFLCVSLF